jgi:hypothetical protein
VYCEAYQNESKSSKTKHLWIFCSNQQIGPQSRRRVSLRVGGIDEIELVQSRVNRDRYQAEVITALADFLIRRPGARAAIGVSIHRANSENDKILPMRILILNLGAASAAEVSNALTGQGYELAVEGGLNVEQVE